MLTKVVNAHYIAPSCLLFELEHLSVDYDGQIHSSTELVQEDMSCFLDGMWLHFARLVRRFGCTDVESVKKEFLEAMCKILASQFIGTDWKSNDSVVIDKKLAYGND